eukprot:gene3721-4661_t
MLPKEPAESEDLPSDECWRRFAPSIDRIRSDGHYTRDNVQLTCVFANVGKAEADDDSFKCFLTQLAKDPTDGHSDVAETTDRASTRARVIHGTVLRPPKRKAPTRGDVVKRKREVALLECDAKEKRIRYSMSELERKHAVESTRNWTTESVKIEGGEVLDTAVREMGTPQYDTEQMLITMIKTKPVHVWVFGLLNVPSEADFLKDFENDYADYVLHSNPCTPVDQRPPVPPEVKVCLNKSLYEHFINTTRAERRYWTGIKFGRALQYLLGVCSRTGGKPSVITSVQHVGPSKTERGKRFATLAECREKFEEALGMPVQWEKYKPLSF